jgi:adenylate kinase family enzyme
LQIELIGCTSAGKSTLIRHILQACREQGIDIILGDDFVLRQVRLDRIKSHLPRTLLVDLLALTACLMTRRKHFKFYSFSTRLLFQLPIAWLEKLNLLRNVVKKIGIHEIICSRGTDQQLILVDEGVLQAAHNLFVHGSIRVKTEHLATFAELIPYPDVVVYLRQPEAVLIDRTMKRGHKRIPDRSYGNVVPFIEQAIATFDKLVQNPAVKSKLLVVDGDRNLTIAADYKDDALFGLAIKVIGSGLTQSLVCDQQVADRS